MRLRLPLDPGSRKRQQPRRGAACAAALALALLATPAFAQQGDVRLESSERLFSVLAALNAGGYDTGLSAQPMESARLALRSALAQKKIPVLPEIAKFYEMHRIPDNPGRDLGQYVSLALLLGPPPDFKLQVNADEAPPDARDVIQFIPLLKEFYRQAGLAELWAKMQPKYEEQIRQDSGPIRTAIEGTDGFLRFQSGAYLGRAMTIYVDLLGAPGEVQARNYGEDYYVVLTPSEKLRVSDVRFEYMHFLLDPLAAKYYTEIERARPLLSIARKAPALGRDFRQDFSLLLTECLIHAAEIRMDALPQAQAQAKVKALTASGFILVPYFYKALGEFERGPASMDVAYEPMILGINPKKEAANLAHVKFRVPPTTIGRAPQVTAKVRMLDAGDNAIYTGHYPEAESAFKQVLETMDPKSERALFGMAVAESNLRKPDLAVQYFKEALATAHDLRIVTWSHIYLGRIYDLMGERNLALKQYQAASLTAAEFPDAVRAIQSGLRLPFGTM